MNSKDNSPDKNLDNSDTNYRNKLSILSGLTICFSNFLISPLNSSTKLTRFFYFSIFLLFFVQLGIPVIAQTQQSVNPIRNRSYYVGLNYPGLTLGYQGSGYSVELRGTSKDDIQLVGSRFSHYIYPFQGGNLYWGLEGYHVSFEDVITEGNGYMLGGIGGIQMYLGSRFSFTVDSGPYFVKLKDNLSGVESDGVQFVINTGVNFHF